MTKRIKAGTSIITRTPLRITLAGGGTDVLWYSRKKGGEWISAAIDKYIYIRLKKAKRFIVSINGKFIPFQKYRIAVESLRLLKIKEPLEISIISKIPPQSGLGGSGAVEVGLLHALHIFKKDRFTKVQIAREAAFIETTRLKMSVGPQDQYISAIGGVNSFLLDRKGRMTIKTLFTSSLNLHALKRNLLFFNTGLAKNTSQILESEKRSEVAIRNLDTIKQLGKMSKQYIISGEVDNFGRLLHIHWLLKRELSSIVSNTKIDQWYNEAIRKGALGGKIMGAGGGGWFMFYVNQRKSLLRQRMQEMGLLEQKVKFDWEGTTLIQSPDIHE